MSEVTAHTEEETTLSALLAIFGITEKAKLVEHCRTAVVHSQDFANLILACEARAIPIRHIPIFRHHHPEHLQLTDADLKAMASAKVGPLEGRARKAFGKIGQMFDERRLFCCHMFWPPTRPGEWHLIYFDQRDIGAAQNHWQHGTHIHLMNMVTHPQLDPNDLLSSLFSEQRPKLGDSLHIRYADRREQAPIGRGDS